MENYEVTHKNIDTIVAADKIAEQYHRVGGKAGYDVSVRRVYQTLNNGTLAIWMECKAHKSREDCRFDVFSIFEGKVYENYKLDFDYETNNIKNMEVWDKDKECSIYTM